MGEAFKYLGAILDIHGDMRHIYEGSAMFGFPEQIERRWTFSRR